MSLKAEWQQVFRKAVKSAKEISASEGITYKKALPKAWKQPAVVKAMKEYEKHSRKVKLDRAKALVKKYE